LNSLLSSTIAFGAPLVLAAIGGFASERGGVINIALEGNMLTGAVATALIGAWAHNPWIGLAGGIFGATCLSWVHWLLTQRYRLDHIVSGMALNAVAIGGANFLSQRFTDPNAGELPGIDLKFYYWTALLLPFAIALYIKHTKGGLRLLAVGNDPSKSRQMGLFPSRVRFLGLTATGVCCGLSGALIVTNARYFTDNMTAGRGYIALAALILGSWRPIPSLIACLVFGLFQGLQIQYQGTPIHGVMIPREVWYSLPYIITIVALAGFLGKSRVPAGLGKY
jgi:simple sugar transport system permease protein